MIQMNNYNFINPEFLYLLAIPIAYIIWLSLRKRNLSSEILFSNTKSIKHLKTLKIKLRNLSNHIKVNFLLLINFCFS